MSGEVTVRATLNRVIDGDTVVMNVELGYDVFVTVHCRLAGINAPEVHGVTKDAGEAAKTYLLTLMGALGAWFAVTANPTQDKYGRWLLVIYRSSDDGVSVNDLMVQSGHAVPYMVS